MRRESLPLAPEIVVDQHARFEKPEDGPLYAHTMALLAELRDRYFVLSHTGCSRPTRNPRIEFGRGYALFDQISFPSWLEEDRDCHVPLKIVDYQNRYAYFVWSQIITTMPKETPVDEVGNKLQTPVRFRNLTIPLIEVGYQGFLGHSDASEFLNEFNSHSPTES